MLTSKDWWLFLACCSLLSVLDILFASQPVLFFFGGGGGRNLVGVARNLNFQPLNIWFLAQFGLALDQRSRNQGIAVGDRNLAPVDMEKIQFGYYIAITLGSMWNGVSCAPGNFTRKKMEKVFPFKYGNPAIKFQRKGSALQNRTWGKIQKSKGKTVRPTKKKKQRVEKGKIW